MKKTRKLKHNKKYSSENRRGFRGGRAEEKEEEEKEEEEKAMQIIKDYQNCKKLPRIKLVLEFVKERLTETLNTTYFRTYRKNDDIKEILKNLDEIVGREDIIPTKETYSKYRIDDGSVQSFFEKLPSKITKISEEIENDKCKNILKVVQTHIKDEPMLTVGNNYYDGKKYLGKYEGLQTQEGRTYIGELYPDKLIFEKERDNPILQTNKKYIDITSLTNDNTENTSENNTSENLGDTSGPDENKIKILRRTPIVSKGGKRKTRRYRKSKVKGMKKRSRTKK